MKRAARGQVAVEAAMAVTAFILLMFGVLDFGRAYWTWQTLATVAREGARWGIVHGADSGLSAKEAEAQGVSWVASQFGKSLPAKAKVDFSWPGGSNEPGNPVRVTIESDYKPTTPLLGKKKIPLRGVSEMRIIR
jgi:Flp pilus assembly protein TadG